MATTQTFDLKAVERFLVIRGWKQSEHDSCIWISPSGDWAVQANAEVNSLEIQRFTDADVEDDRYTRTREEAEVSTLPELEEKLVALGAIPFTCSYCGEEGGEPVTVFWSEFQGVSGHGGMVDFQDGRCTKCVRRR